MRRLMRRRGRAGLPSGGGAQRRGAVAAVICALTLSTSASAIPWTRPTMTAGSSQAETRSRPLVSRPLASRPLASRPLASSDGLSGQPSGLHLNRHIPYWRLALSGACAIAAIGQHGASERVGWTTLGSGLLVWAFIDWFVPELRSAAAD